MIKKDGINDFFQNYLSKSSIFKNKKVLQANYMPETIFHRDPQLRQMADIMAPVLKLEKPSNLFLYGKTGTGKTLSMKHINDQLTQVASQNNIPLRITYINCKLKKVADTEYRLISQLLCEFGKPVSFTGLPTDELYKQFFNTMDNEEIMYILVLDEIDQLVKRNGNDILYNLTRINSELKKSQLTLVGISNDWFFAENLDLRIKSSLGWEEILFPPYNAVQIQMILRNRSDLAFETGCIQPGVVEKCAAYAAREHGDARRAIDLLRVSAEIAERDGCESVAIDHIDKAEAKIERDRVFEIIKTQPKQFQAVLYSIFKIHEQKPENIFTGEVYELYKEISTRIGLGPLTQRRVSDIVAELDMLGIVSVTVISKGRYGRTREINIATPPSANPRIMKILSDELSLA